MSILLWILFGAVAGWIASMIMGSEGSIGRDILMGILGAIAGGFLMNVIGQEGVTGFNIYSLLVAVLGSIVLIAIGRAFRRSTV